MDNKKDICDKIAVIPQFEGTCWFNAILMICFYSQDFRNLLIKYSKQWKKDNLFNFFRTILKYNYNLDKKNLKIFSNIKPELILLKIFENYNIYIKHFYKTANSHTTISKYNWGIYL